MESYNEKIEDERCDLVGLTLDSQHEGSEAVIGERSEKIWHESTQLLVHHYGSQDSMSSNASSGLIHSHQTGKVTEVGST